MAAVSCSMTLDSSKSCPPQIAFYRPPRTPCLLPTFFQLFRPQTLVLSLNHNTYLSHWQVLLGLCLKHIQDLPISQELHSWLSGANLPQHCPGITTVSGPSSLLSHSFYFWEFYLRVNVRGR